MQEGRFPEMTATLLPTRLRTAANGMKGVHADVAREAADEIERLQKCEAALRAIMEAHGPGTLCNDEIYEQACDALKPELNGQDRW